MDTSEIARLAMEAMEACEGAPGRLLTCAVLFEVEDDPSEEPVIFFRCSDTRAWVQRAFFDEAVQAVDQIHVDD